MSGIRSRAVCMDEHILGEVNPLNEFQYLKGLVSTVVHVEDTWVQKKNT